MERFRRRRVDWQAVQAHYDAGLGARACMARFGLSPAAWSAAADAGLLRTRPHGISFDALLEGRRAAPPRERPARTGAAPLRCRAASRPAPPPPEAP